VIQPIEIAVLLLTYMQQFIEK